MEDKQKINQLRFQIGLLTFYISIKQMQLSLKGLKPEVKAFGFLKECFNNVDIKVPVGMFDYKYYLVDWSEWQGIRKLIINKVFPYYKDKFDCDNYGHLFSSLTSLIMGVNTAGSAYGTVYNARGEKIARHYFNIIATKDGKLYCFEPMNGNSCLIEKGKPITMAHGWKYEIINCKFY